MSILSIIFKIMFNPMKPLAQQEDQGMNYASLNDI